MRPRSTCWRTPASAFSAFAATPTRRGRSAAWRTWDGKARLSRGAPPAAASAATNPNGGLVWLSLLPRHPTGIGAVADAGEPTGVDRQQDARDGGSRLRTQESDGVGNVFRLRQ